MEGKRQHFLEKLPCHFKSGSVKIGNTNYDFRVINGCGAVLTVSTKGQTIDQTNLSLEDLRALYLLLGLSTKQLSSSAVSG